MRCRSRHLSHVRQAAFILQDLQTLHDPESGERAVLVAEQMLASRLNAA